MYVFIYLFMYTGDDQALTSISLADEGAQSLEWLGRGVVIRHG